ncbi:MAG TPA: glycosyltransferase family 2 protein [Candidatus Copromonas faecavium]|uniref:Glycosyltransferase family 2 protein n=1 Tax=Candidatus Copromonas faecavium (nom. illeg.) TaxID=2840740 RepID=A0A9D1A676_9FIRM|nr:glycosyltransferase family 2 protein [Candidatus Copromonas faecavium]
MGKLLSVVVSVYNEEPGLREFYQETKKVLEELPAPWEHELLFVNDGSRDGSLSILRELAAADSHVRLINFSRNFGHEAAMIAGIDYAAGDGIVCMDADLQHPPECIPRILEKFDQGFQVITMVRTKNRTAGLVKNVTSAAFYRLINCLSDVKFEANASDFFAVSRQAADVLRRNYREKVRFLRGYVQSIGFQRATLEYEARPRIAGESKYSIRSLFKFSINTILCFSDLPLKLGIYSGIAVALFGIAMAVYTIYTWAEYGTPSGYATIVVLLSFMFAMLFIIVGIIGEYIAILFAELKDRPVYIVEDMENFPSGTEHEKKMDGDDARNS